MALVNLSQTAYQTTPTASLSALNGTPAKSPKPAQSNPAPATSSASSTTSSTTASTRTGSGSKGASHGSSGAGGSSAAAETDAAVYTTTVGGKTYSGTVEYSDGQYVVSLPGLSGATASGSTAQAAEDALGTVIDILA